MNIPIQVPDWTCAFISSGQILRSEMPECTADTCLTFMKQISCFPTWCTIPIKCTILHSHQQYVRVPLAPHTQYHRVSLFRHRVFCNVIKTTMRFPITNDVEYLFVCLFAIRVFSLVSVQIFYPLFNWVIFSLLSCKKSLYILHKVIWQIHFCQYFLSLWLAFLFLSLSAEKQMFLI